MFHKILFICTILFIVGMAIVLHHFSQTSDLLKKYQKLGLIQSDLQYERVEKSWGNQGLIFYQVQFPFIEIPVQANRMHLSLSDTGMGLNLEKAHIKVIEGLKKIHGSQMALKLNEYVPYQDFISHLLTSMAVMGIDEFVGDIFVNTVYSDAQTMHFDIRMDQENQPTLQMQGTIHIPIVGAHQISDLWNGQLESAEIKVKDSLFDRYINYAKSRQIALPNSIKKGLLKIKGKVQPLFPLKNILK